MNKSDNAALDLDQAFTAIKLWMMLSRRKPSKNALNHEEDMVLNKGMDLGIEEAVQDNRDRTVWNELWPAFENVLTAAAVEGPEELTVSFKAYSNCRSPHTYSIIAVDTCHLVFLCGACHLSSSPPLPDSSRDIGCSREHTEESSQAH